MNVILPLCTSMSKMNFIEFISRNYNIGKIISLSWTFGRLLSLFLMQKNTKLCILTTYSVINKVLRVLIGFDFVCL